MQIKDNQWLIAIAIITGLIFYAPFSQSSKTSKNWQNSAIAIAENYTKNDTENNDRPEEAEVV